MPVVFHDCYLAECTLLPYYCCYMLPHEPPDGPWSSLVHSHSPPSVLWFLCAKCYMCVRVCGVLGVPDSPSFL